jgi:hypothetical protein
MCVELGVDRPARARGAVTVQITAYVPGAQPGPENDRVVGQGCTTSQIDGAGLYKVPVSLAQQAATCP